MDVDGDQLNVVTEPLFVEIAERNIKKFDVVPLFYDAYKAAAEPVDLDAMYRALKRAHDYSAGEITSIGEISNMLTKLWNKDNPDRDVANLLCMFNNWVIDAAKTGEINHYKDYPAVAKRVGRATGGRNGQMPYFFKWSKNGRKNTPQNKKKKYAVPNNSTMNRICRAFDDIGRINLNYAGVNQFNWQMLLTGPCTNSRPEIPALFCDLDDANLPNVIRSQENNYSNEKQLINNYALMAEDITRIMTEKYGSLEYVYPYIVKYLFAGEGVDKAAHKRMFWRIFGNIALANLKANIKTCSICDICHKRIPSWANTHQCIKNVQGFFECIDCGIMCERKNPKQCRCEGCQEVYRRTFKTEREKKKRRMKKAAELKRTIALQSSSSET